MSLFGLTLLSPGRTRVFQGQASAPWERFKSAATSWLSSVCLGHLCCCQRTFIKWRVCASVAHCGRQRKQPLGDQRVKCSLVSIQLHSGKFHCGGGGVDVGGGGDGEEVARFALLCVCVCVPPFSATDIC